MNTKKLVLSAMVAATYIVISMLLGSVSFGVINIRLAVGLTMAAFFGIEFMIGVFVAHVLTNLFGGLGLVDIIIGPLMGLLCMYIATTIDKITNKEKKAWARWLIMTIMFIPASIAIGVYLSLMFGVPAAFMCLMVIAGNAIAQFVVGYPILLIMGRLVK